MERLVIQDAVGSLCYNDTDRGLKLEPNEITPHLVRLLLERLHMYEDVGLTPEQIQKLKERDIATTPEAAEEQPFSENTFAQWYVQYVIKRLNQDLTFAVIVGNG